MLRSEVRYIICCGVFPCCHSYTTYCMYLNSQFKILTKQYNCRFCNKSLTAKIRKPSSIISLNTTEMWTLAQTNPKCEMCLIFIEDGNPFIYLADIARELIWISEYSYSVRLSTRTRCLQYPRNMQTVFGKVFGQFDR